MALYTVDYPVKEFANVLSRLGACQEGIDSLHAQCPDLDNATMQDAFLALPNEGWALWLLKVLGADMSQKLHELLIDKIESPAWAFATYLEVASLSDEDDRLLEAKFKGIMPTAEQELADGVVTRAKK